MQHQFLRHIAEIHAVHDDVAPERLVFHLAAGLVSVLPGPESCPLLRLMQRAVLVRFRVHQHDVAVVRLRRFVHKSVDPVRAGGRHGHRVHLHRDLGEGAVEVPVQGQE